MTKKQAKTCRWRKDFGSIYWAASCNDKYKYPSQHYNPEWYKYCPFCGRKVKVENDGER